MTHRFLYYIDGLNDYFPSFMIEIFIYIFKMFSYPIGSIIRHFDNSHLVSGIIKCV